VKLVPYAHPFNFSEKCNIGVSQSSGDVIVLCNDDIQLMPGGGLHALVGPLAEPSVGMVGAYLLYEDGHVQHAGHQYSEGGFRHALTGWRDGDAGPFAALMVDREVSGVTAALAAMRRDDYIAVGGMSEELPVNFNDVDLCMKVRMEGLRIVWAHRARAYHFESRTRDRSVDPVEVATLRRRWGRPAIDAFVKPDPALRELGVPDYPSSGLRRPAVE
jgi:GT2 family glycosyltransferase